MNHPFCLHGSQRLIAIIVLAALLAGCTNKDLPQTVAIVPKVVCSPAISQSITDYDVFVGRTEAAETVNVQARVSGFLRSVEFTDGQFVTAEQLLATIEADEYEAIHKQSEARIELAKAKLKLAESEFARSKKLLQNAAVSQEEYDSKASAVQQATAEVVVAEADAARTALDLKYTKILAPISGRIDRAFVTPGNMVTGGLGAGTMLTRIVNVSPMFAYFDVDEASILSYIRKESSIEQAADAGSEANARRSLKELQLPCYLQLQDEDDFPHVGTLDFLETQVDASTGTIRLRGTFANEKALLQSGMYVRVRIPTSEPYEAVMIPEIAIGTDQSFKFAYVVDENGQAVRRTLKLGEQMGPMRVVLEGVAKGETVIERGVQRVRP
ncbi:MAG: efflux RND transporter periplasmic adaptor subunit, partial [Planctomycetota bacterium]